MLYLRTVTTQLRDHRVVRSSKLQWHTGDDATTGVGLLDDSPTENVGVSEDTSR